MAKCANKDVLVNLGKNDDTVVISIYSTSKMENISVILKIKGGESFKYNASISPVKMYKKKGSY